MTMPKMNLNGSVAFITGAADGIGLATTRWLVQHGTRVVMTDVNTARLEEAAASLDQDMVCTATADVRDLDAVRAAVAAGIDRFGRLDIAIANAGITPPPATLRSDDPADFERVVDVNLIGTYNTVKAAVEPVIATRGHIEIIASCAAFSPGTGGSAYMITKAGVEQLGRALRLELAASGTTVGLIYFGIVETQLTRGTLDEDPLGEKIGSQLPWPLNRRISVDEAARVVGTAVEKRSARVTAPRAWAAYSVLRGVINPLLDERLVRDDLTHSIVRALDDRARQSDR